MSSTVLTLPARSRPARWTWPEYPAYLFEDRTGYHVDVEHLNRAQLDACLAAELAGNRPAMLCDLVADGAVELSDPAMAGVVAGLWFAEVAPCTALWPRRWTELFRANGFTVDGRAGAVPDLPVQLFRPCIPALLAYNARLQIVGTVDDFGRVSDPHHQVVEVRDTRLGMTWFSDLRRARRFARSLGADGQVFAAQFAPAHLLARAGTEWVADTSALRLAELSPVSVAVAR